MKKSTIKGEAQTSARQRIGQQLAAIRREAGLSQEQLAERCEISRTTIVKIERGAWSPSVDYLDGIASHLDAEIMIEKKEKKVCNILHD